MSRRTRSLIAGSLLSVLWGSSTAHAQTPVVRPERLPELGRSVVTSDDSTATRSNPANLAFMPSTELRWSSVYLEEDLEVPWQGHAISLATPLPFSLATGFRLDLVAPPDGTGLVVDHNYQWFTWALALRTSRKSAFGFSLQTSFSEGAYANDLGGFSLGYSHRPWDAIAYSLAVHDINAPRNGYTQLERSWNGGVSVRPLGTRGLELALESSYVEDDDLWTPRVVLGIDVPYVGRLRGDVAVSDPTRESSRAWLASGGLSFYLNHMGGSSELAGGIVTGDGLGRDGSINPHTSFATRGFREPVGLDPERYAVRIRVENTPSGRAHIGFLRQLWSLAEEPNVDAVVFDLKSSPADSLARLQELRDAVFHLRRHGKRTSCHLEDGSGGAMFFCAATNRTYVNPAGGLRFAGLRSQHLYFARLLEKLGIRAEFVRIGEHKSAPEQLTERRSTEVSRADKVDLIQQYERHFTEALALGRNLSVATVRERLARGPFIAREAKEAGLVDELAFDDEIEKKLKELTGRDTPLKLDRRVRTAPKDFGNSGYVAVIHIDGDIIDGRSRSIPFFGMNVTGSYTIADTLKAVRENQEIKAVVLRVESPGGSSMASDVIWRQVQLTAKVKPTVVSMGTVAASGGYYVAAPAARVFANPLSITGSIGVFYAKADVSQLLDRIGIDVEVYKTQPHADAESFFRPLSPEERQGLGVKVDQFYQLFLERVAEGRKLTKQQVDAVGQGRVWTGEQALQHGLVDELGGLRQALAYARAQAGLPESAPIIELPVIEQSLLARLVGIGGLQQSLLDAPMPEGLTKTLRALGPFVIHPGDKPLARLDFTLDELE